jgi:hypothetical protein
MHYARRPNVVIESEDAERTWGLKVRSLSLCDPVPLGKNSEIDADWVVVCTRVREEIPMAVSSNLELDGLNDTLKPAEVKGGDVSDPLRFSRRFLFLGSQLLARLRPQC